MGVFGSISALSQGWTATARLWGGSLSLLVLAGACGGGSAAPAKDADDADDASEVGSSDTASAASDDESVEAGPTGPDCSDQTCFPCGEGMCPVGFYCDEKANKGPACSWLPECADAASCSCVTSVLGSSCSCDDASGGPHVTCD